MRASSCRIRVPPRPTSRLDVLTGVPFSELALLAGAIMAGGVVTGILAGLFGIGGGAIIVPVLYEVYRALGVPERLLLGPGRLDPIRTTAVAEQRVREAVEGSGGVILESEPDEAAGPHIPSRRYVAARSGAAL